MNKETLDRLETKLDRLLRHHRQRVFDDRSGPAHERALRRLKNTKIAFAVFLRREQRGQERENERLLRMWA